MYDMNIYIARKGVYYSLYFKTTLLTSPTQMIMFSKHKWFWGRDEHDHLTLSDHLMLESWKKNLKPRCPK